MEDAAPLLVAKTSFSCHYDGRRVVIHAGETRIRADHPIVKGREHLFSEVGVSRGIEDARARPGQKRPEPPPESGPDTKAVRAWATENGIDVPKRGKISDAVVEAYTAAHAAPAVEPAPEPTPEPAPHEG
jgi:hypothetical protein